LVGFTVLALLLAVLGPWLVDEVSAANTNRSQVRPRVMVLIFNPIIESQDNRRLVDLEGWSDPFALNGEYAQVLKDASRGFARYSIRSVVEVDAYPEKDNGHVFTDEEYLQCLMPDRGPNCALIIDYPKLLRDYGICDLSNKKKISELWLWGGPWFGFWEAVQAGPDPIITNGPPIVGTDCQRTLDIMGFSYERGVADMVHDFAHRVEGNMDHVYGRRAPDETNPWNKFTLVDRDTPGRGGCGTVHDPVNAPPGEEYIYWNTQTVPSSCDDFLNYPDLTGTFVDVNCSTWGCTDLGYYQWWLGHLPRAHGVTDGKLNNWWAYVLHP